MFRITTQGVIYFFSALKIHISQPLQELLVPFEIFDMEERGSMEIKVSKLYI